VEKLIAVNGAGLCRNVGKIENAEQYLTNTGTNRRNGLSGEVVTITYYTDQEHPGTGHFQAAPGGIAG